MDIVLMAAVSGFESLSKPNRQDMVQFAALFPNLFAQASDESRRTAAAALSRLDYLPSPICELILNQPVEIAAPFISHSTAISELQLITAIRTHGAGHARAAARRASLSPELLAVLWSLEDERVNRALALRDLTLESQFAADIVMTTPVQSSDPAQESRFDLGTGVPPLARLDELNDEGSASEGLREHLRGLVKLSETDSGLTNRRANPRPAANNQASARVGAMEALVTAHRDFGTDAQRRALAMGGNLARLVRYAASGEASWFATALADAMNSSFALAERIMLDLSGAQLATAMISLGADDATTLTALTTYFPHLSAATVKNTVAEDLLASLDRLDCAERFAAWQRADAYSNYSGATDYSEQDENLPDADNQDYSTTRRHTA